MKKDGRSRRSFNDAVGRSDDPPWHLVKCPQCGDKDATQNTETWWCRECGWKPCESTEKSGAVESISELSKAIADAAQARRQSAPQARPAPQVSPTPAAPLARDPAQPQAQQPKPSGLVCRTVITKRK